MHLSPEHHGQCSCVSQPLLVALQGQPCCDVCHQLPHAFIGIFQHNVEGGLFAKFNLLECLSWLVVSQHLHFLYLSRAKVFAHHGVAVAHEVHPFYVEAVDGFSLKGYLAVFVHVDAFHSFEYVAYRAVLLLSIGVDEIVEGVAPLCYGGRLHCHFF